MITETQASRDLLGDGDGSMMATGAADSDGEIALSLCQEGWQQEVEEIHNPLGERLGLLVAKDIVTNWRLESGHVSQLVDPVRVGQEPCVEDHVDVHRQAVLEAEGHDRGPHGIGSQCVAKDLRDPTPKLCCVELPCLENDVGSLSQALEGDALLRDGLLDARPGPRVAPPCAFVATDEDIVGGV